MLSVPHNHSPTALTTLKIPILSPLLLHPLKSGVIFTDNSAR